MQVLADFDSHDYLIDWPRYTREAVRAIILQDRKIALVKSQREGFYKFPGGGIQAGESHEQALMRETREETGIDLLQETIRPYGRIHEIRKGLFEENEIFEQNSYYYLARAASKMGEQALDAYEAQLGFELEWVNIGAAYEANMMLAEQKKHLFLLREAYVLQLLLENC